ncbi:hypothetical protein [Nonomuraea sp. NPDC052265]|uniref:hypothetical protein n=1 Tax=Nonomuraea sp. NPDC052265 TaxID=3364374 RepID=UPI0037CBBE7F
MVLGVASAYHVESLVWAVTRAVLMAGVGVLAAVVVALAARPLLRGALRRSTGEPPGGGRPAA